MKLELPDYCYAEHPENESPIKVVTGVNGYYEAPGINVKSENEKLGVTEEQAEAMLDGSIFGWKIHGFKKCPHCGEYKLHPIEIRNALSRRDNQTYICTDCGTAEAIEDLRN